MSYHYRIRQYDKSIVCLTGESANGCVDFVSTTHTAIDSLGCHRCSFGFNALPDSRQRDRIPDNADTGYARRDFLEYLQPFSTDCGLEVCESSHMTARSSQVRDDAGALRIGNPQKHYRD